MQISIQNFKLLNFYKLVFNFVFRGQTTSKTLALIFTSYNKQRSPKFKSYKIFLLTCMSLQLKRILHNEDLVIVLRSKSVLWNASKGLHCSTSSTWFRSRKSTVCCVQHAIGLIWFFYFQTVCIASSLLCKWKRLMQDDGVAINALLKITDLAENLWSMHNSISDCAAKA